MTSSDQQSGGAEHTDDVHRSRGVPFAFLLATGFAIVKFIAGAAPTPKGLAGGALLTIGFLLILLPVAVVMMRVEIKLKQRYA